jgi:hypothetical protein
LGSSAGRASNEQEGGAPEQFAPMKPQGRPPAKAPYLRSVNLAGNDGSDLRRRPDRDGRSSADKRRQSLRCKRA